MKQIIYHDSVHGQRLILMRCLALWLAFSPFILDAQKSNWKIEQFSAHILKVSYIPDDYTRSENVSDAVILKPRKAITMKYKMDRDAITVMGQPNITITYLQKDGNHGFEIDLHKKEEIFGGGERALPLNRRGYQFNLDNNPWYEYQNGADNLNFSVPFFTSSLGYGLFFDNVSKGKVDIGKTDPQSMQISFSSGEINVFIIYGSTPKDILSRYHQLTGSQGLPPRWALGNFMSRFGYSSEAQVENIANQMISENMPFDAIIFDLFWFGDSIKGTMGNLDWVNKKRWPDPKSMIQKFKNKNIKSILITEPFVLTTTPNYEASKAYHAVDSLGKPYILTDFYFGQGGLIDIFRKDAQQWFWEKHDAQNKIGIEAWWGDLGEPEKHPKTLFHNLKDLGYQRLFGAHEVHNMYGHLWTKMLFEKYAQLYPNVRLFSLNRSGFAGSQRYQIFPWSGDVSRSWSGLQAQLLIMLGMSMSGIPYIHADAGGFAGGDGDEELYTRWLQFAAFTPIFRPHGTALFELDPQATSFPSEPIFMKSPYKEINRKTIQQRYKLLPYNYSLCYGQTMLGLPLVAPLYYHFPKDSIARKIEDQFMWGPSLLVAPILNKGQLEREVYLPKGRWYRFLDSGKIESESFEQNVSVRTNIDENIIFVKAGSFIPTVDKIGRTTEDYTTDSLTVHYYFSTEKSEFMMFDDDGKNKHSIAQKLFELISFKAYAHSKKLTLDIQKTNTSYPGQPKKRFIKMIIHGGPKFNHATISKKNKTTTLPLVASGREVHFEMDASTSRIIFTK